MRQKLASAPGVLVILSYWRNRDLIAQMATREVVGRYKGSLLGLLWSFFHPVMMLAVYTFVFSEVFKVRWGGEMGSKGQFAQILFSGLIIFGFFTECVNRAPSLIVSNPNFVKKVVFPLDALAWISLLSSLFHTSMSLLVLLLFSLALNGGLPWTIVLFPIVLFPLALLTMGISWFLAALGVYLRDIGQVVGVLTSLTLFISPIFYPVDLLPENLQPFWYLNPLTFIIEETRAVLIWEELPNWWGLGIYLTVGMAIAWSGYYFFHKTRRGFADVL